MKRIKKLGTILLSVALFLGVAAFPAAAADGGSISQILSVNKVVTEGEESVAVSKALDVISAESDMAMAGIKGNALYFSADRFACAMNLSKIDYITVTALPDAMCGSLYIGSQGVSVGQTLQATELALMTYEEASSGIGKDASFDFSVNGSAYEISCNIYMIDEINYSPTLSLASYASLNAETYRGVKMAGVLSAYDPEGDELRYEIVEYPENGRVVLENRNVGRYTYIPNASFTGEDSFRYVVRDKYGNYSASEKVTLTVSAPGTSTVYSDLVDDEIYCHAISMTESGLMNGVQVGDYYYFEADREVTRSEFLVTAMKAVGIKNLPDADSTVFYDDSDINPEMKSYVALAYSKGYISGKSVDGNNLFMPNEVIKLSEAAVIVSNMIGYAEPKVDLIFADADAIPSWSGKAIDSLHTLGILETPEMISGADRVMTRGDMAKLLSKTMLVIGK
jgi:hypothetical protein